MTTKADKLLGVLLSIGVGLQCWTLQEVIALKVKTADLSARFETHVHNPAVATATATTPKTKS